MSVIEKFTESLHLKIAFLVLSVLTLVSGVIFYVQYRLNVKHLTDTVKVSAAHLSNTLEKSFEIAMLGRRLDEIQQALEEIGRDPQIERIFIVNKSGEIKVSSDRTALGVVMQISERTCQVCHQHRPSDRQQTIMLDTGDRKFVRSVNPILKKPVCERCHLGESRVLGMLITDVSATEIDALAKDNLRISFLMILISVVLMAGAFRVGFKRIILDRLVRLSTAAKKMEQGDFSARLSLPTKDELGLLAGTFNRMADNLQGSLERIEAARAYLEGLINSIDDGVAVIKRDRTIALLNDQYLRMFEKDVTDRSRFICAALAELNPLHGKWCESQESRCNICNVFHTGQPSNREVIFKSESGEEKVYDSHVSVISRDENGIWEVVEDLRDITVRKTLERQMVQTEKLVSVGELAAGVAHEINNPMASITTCAEGLIRMIDTIQMRDDNKKEFCEYLETIRSSAFRCKAITERLLNFSSGRATDFELLDLNELVGEAIRLVEYDISAKNVNLEFRPDPEIPRLKLSRTSFPQVIVNLLLNSLYAVDRGGTIILRTAQKNGHVLLEVSDDGRGISDENLARVFDPFFTTKRHGEGSGLGLPTCRAIVHNHNGEISIQSKPHEGTKVIVRLPVEER